VNYFLWTIGCQMNDADSRRVASELEKLGYHHVDQPDQADIVVLNTCVVRQKAEDKIYGRLGSLKPLKAQRPDTIIGLMGCLVGVHDPGPLRKRFPWVDVFMPPSDPGPLLGYLADRGLMDEGQALDQAQVAWRHQLQEQVDELLLPAHMRGKLVAANVPIVLGCSHACTFCIIPHRRGVERSRSVGEIVAEVRSLVDQGVREVTLLGQIVDRYGKDIPDGPTLADLLRVVHAVEGLQRIRFLTSHPNWITDELLDAVAELPKVCEHIEVPVQAGDDQVLAAMKRGYTVDQYRRLIERLRSRLPGTAINTDIIVGFPGESEGAFQRTYDLLAELRLDKAHIAKYSPRPGTVSARRLPDDVPPQEKERRRRTLDELQQSIVAEINGRLLGQTVEVLVEGKKKGKWYGRTRANKLVFFENGDNNQRGTGDSVPNGPALSTSKEPALSTSKGDWHGRLVPVQITWTGPWSMQGQIAKSDEKYASPLSSQVSGP
jgi:tRNA-2-methylthio-N6-dimethylallyladenosine synthase